jgi:hypothetical protein
MKILAALLSVFVSLPISCYISYSLLSAIHADRLLWFLFWINIPVILFAQLALKLMEKE